MAGQTDSNTMTQPRLLRIQELLTHAIPCRAIEDVRRQIQEEHKGAMDESTAREQQNWSFVANRVVGREGNIR